MAIYVKPIPTLTGAVAENFERVARANEAKRGSIDFSQQVQSMQAILKRSNRLKERYGLH